MQSLIKSFGPRIIAAAVASIAGYIYSKTHGSVTVDTTQVSELVTGMLLTYATIHRLASSKINPEDSTKP